MKAPIEKNRWRLVFIGREINSDVELSIYLVTFLPEILHMEEIPEDIIDRDQNRIREKYWRKISEYCHEYIIGNYNLSEAGRKLFIYLDKYLGY